ncbi:MAG: Fur family transcriptional regulator [Clostridiaceae bacterium]
MLREKGIKFTKQKQSVLNVLLKTDIHLSVWEIHEKLKGEPVSIATIYRSLKVFNEAGIVKEIYINGKSCYELKMFSGKPLNIHFTCRKCNRVIDINSKKTDVEYIKLNRIIEQENDIEIFDSNIMFTGLCGSCKKERDGDCERT